MVYLQIVIKFDIIFAVQDGIARRVLSSRQHSVSSVLHTRQDGTARRNLPFRPRLVSYVPLYTEYNGMICLFKYNNY